MGGGVGEAGDELAAVIGPETPLEVLLGARGGGEVGRGEGWMREGGVREGKVVEGGLDEGDEELGRGRKAAEEGRKRGREGRDEGREGRDEGREGRKGAPQQIQGSSAEVRLRGGAVEEVAIGGVRSMRVNAGTCEGVNEGVNEGVREGVRKGAREEVGGAPDWGTEGDGEGEMAAKRARITPGAEDSEVLVDGARKTRGTPGAAMGSAFETCQQQARVTAEPDVLVGRKRDSSEAVEDGGDGVGGLRPVIRSLTELVLLPLRYPSLFPSLGITPPRGVLLHGLPGTGKTLVVRALAGACARGEREVAFFARHGADCLGKYVGDAEKHLRLLFEVAKQRQPSIIFFDELDGLAPARGPNQDPTHSSVVATLLALLDGLDSRGAVTVIAATNRIDAIDPALRRPGRFVREIFFPLPGFAGRKAILRAITGGWGMGVAPSGKVLEELARRSEGFAGADLRAVCNDALMAALRKKFPMDKALALDVLPGDETTSSGQPQLPGAGAPSYPRGTGSLVQAKMSRLPIPEIHVEACDWLEALQRAQVPCALRTAAASFGKLEQARSMAPCVLLLPRVNTWVVEGWKDGRGMGVDGEVEEAGEEEGGKMEEEKVGEGEEEMEESDGGLSEESREEKATGEEEDEGREDEEGGGDEEGDGREGCESGEWASFEQLMAVVESQLSSSAALLHSSTTACIHVVATSEVPLSALPSPVQRFFLPPSSSPLSPSPSSSSVPSSPPFFCPSPPPSPRPSPRPSPPPSTEPSPLTGLGAKASGLSLANRYLPLHVLGAILSPADQIRPPADQIRPPADQIRLPADQIRPPADQIRPPADQIRPPADQIRPPADQIRPPADQIRPPADQIRPPADQIRPPADQIRPPADQIRPPADQIRPPADQIRPPADQIRPPADQIRPPADQIRPPADQIRPPADQIRPPADRICPLRDLPLRRPRFPLQRPQFPRQRPRSARRPRSTRRRPRSARRRPRSARRRLRSARRRPQPARRPRFAR
ncbi:unnamed protein product [Closterium sp. Yama58-4]|nr:unnamed protein product [Closterium sp. Yama58-4]